jgi:signal transduction histidine kinase
MPRSLQSRLLLGFFVGMTAILTVGGFVIYNVIERHLVTENDKFVRERLAFFESSIQLRLTRGVVSAVYRFIPLEWIQSVTGENPDLIQGWFVDTGKPFDPPPDLPGTPERKIHPLPRPEVKGDEVVFVDHTLEDGRRARLCSRVFVPARANANVPALKVQVVAGRDLSALQGTLAKVRRVLVRFGLGVMAVVLVVSGFIIRRGVKPVKSLAHQIEVMPLADEGARFALPGAPSELQPVVGRLNALMDRVGAAIEHERQFASNAAHELRNPLAAMRGKIEVALSRTRKAEEYEEALENIWQSQQGMQRVVDHLLLLARLESGHRQSEFVAEAAQLGRLLKKAWRGCIDNADEKHLRVSWHVEDAETEFLAPLSLLDIVFSNLLCNAANYTPAGGEVRIHAALKDGRELREATAVGSGGEGRIHEALKDGRCRVAVENTNPGLTAELLERTFTPFWRADPNASGHRGNAGIGLALCRRIAMTLGGTISASLTPTGMVRFDVELPVELAVPKHQPPAARESEPQPDTAVSG